MAFERLKELLMTSPILAMPTDTDHNILDTDTSRNSIGAVLSQVQNDEEKVIAYASGSYSTAEHKVVRHDGNC